MNDDELTLLFERLDLSGGCWLWTGGTNGVGYGKIYLRHGHRYVHRLLWEFFNGPIPEGTEIDHLCRNPGCVNPDHLEPVSHRENILRGVGPPAINAAATECLRGHPFDAANTYVHPGGKRQCRTCKAKRAHEYHARRRNGAKEKFNA